VFVHTFASGATYQRHSDCGANLNKQAQTNTHTVIKTYACRKAAYQKLKHTTALYCLYVHCSRDRWMEGEPNARRRWGVDTYIYIYIYIHIYVFCSSIAHSMILLKLELLPLELVKQKLHVCMLCIPAFSHTAKWRTKLVCETKNVYQNMTQTTNNSFVLSLHATHQTVCSDCVQHSVSHSVTLMTTAPEIGDQMVQWDKPRRRSVALLLRSVSTWWAKCTNKVRCVCIHIYIYICTYTYIHKSTMVWYSYSPKRLWTPVELPTASIQTDRWTHHLWLNGSGSHLHGSRGQQTRPSYVPCIDYLYIYIYIYIYRCMYVYGWYNCLSSSPSESLCDIPLVRWAVYL
jgi:hypothetical protein